MIRNSKLTGPRRSASQWKNWHRKATPTTYPMRNMGDIGGIGISHWAKSGKNAPMRLSSDFRTAVTLMNRLHRESGEERPERIPFQQYQRWHPSSSKSTRWQWDKEWWNSYIFKFVVVGSFTADGNLLQPTGRCKQYTSHCTFFSCTRNDMSHDIGSSVCARHPIHVSCA